MEKGESTQGTETIRKYGRWNQRSNPRETMVEFEKDGKWLAINSRQVRKDGQIKSEFTVQLERDEVEALVKYLTSFLKT